MSINNNNFVVTVQVAGALTAGNLAPTVALPFDAELVAVTAAVGTAPSAGPVTLDVKKNGSTVYAGANATAAKAVIAQAATVGSVSKPVRGVAASTVVLGAAGAAYSPGSNVITPYTSDGNHLADLTGGTDALSFSLAGTTTSAADLFITLHLLKK